MQNFTEEDIREVYEWVDTFNLSKVKRNIARDFSDGVLVFELMKPSYPDLVVLNTIVPAHNKKDKRSNWEYIRSILIRKGSCES